MTHPDALAALAALRSARQAWPWLADLVAAGPTDRRRGGHITPAAAARRDQLLREERADLVGQQRSGLRPVGASPVPIDLDVVDAQEAALALAVDEAWRVSSTNVVDVETGAADEATIPQGSFVLFTHEPCHLYHTNRYGNGTVVLTIKGHKPQGPQVVNHTPGRLEVALAMVRDDPAIMRQIVELSATSAVSVEAAARAVAQFMITTTEGNE